MSVRTETAPAAGAPSPKRRPWRERGGVTRLLVFAGAIFGVMVVLRIVTGETAITSSGTARAALALGVPIGLAGLGGLWAERSGVVNIGLEGMLIFGTWGAAFGSYFSGNPWLGLLTGVATGALGGLLHAVVTVTFGVDHIVSGVAINILAPGVARYLSTLVFTGETGGGATQSPNLPDFPTVGVPWIGGPLGDLEKHHWFLISDLAGLVRGLTTELSALTVIALVLLPVSYWVLWHTPFGLRVRSCGENPWAAESLGVRVYRMKYAAVVISGALAGLGGVFLAMVSSSQYQEGQTNGRGFIGLAAMIFGNWRPGGLAAGTGLFGYTDALQLRGAAGAVHALLLAVGVFLVVLAVWQLAGAARAGSVGAGGVRIGPVQAGGRDTGFPWRAVFAFVVGVVVLLWYGFTDELPQEIVTYTPHFTTLLVLSFASQRLRMPAADGQIYRKGETH